MNRRVVITGMGIITAHGVGKEVNWAKTGSAESSIGRITSFDASRYRGSSGGEARGFKHARIERLNEKRLDRASHLLIQTVREAIVESGLSDRISDFPALLSLGTTLGGMLSGQLFLREVLAKGLSRARVSLISDYLAHNQAINLFKEFGLRGDFVTFTNACASGTNAIGYGFRSIGSGRWDLAICGGYDTMSEFTFAGFNSLMAISPGLCRPYDLNRDGLVLGEGAGILVLEELQHARKRGARICGEVVGYGESSDAYHLTSPDPTGTNAARAIKMAWESAGFPRIDYINGHGTGTKYNDIMETKAIRAVFENGAEIPVSSIKPAVGHLLGAAGAAEAVISMLAISNKILPPNLNFETPDPEVRLNVVAKAAQCDIRTVLSNSFGFGGSNASIILKGW